MTFRLFRQGARSFFAVIACALVAGLAVAPAAEARDSSKKFSFKKVFKKKSSARRTARPSSRPRGILKKSGGARGHFKTNHNRRVRFNINRRRRDPGYSPNRGKTAKKFFNRRRPAVRRARAPKLRGILKKPGKARGILKTNHKRRVRFNTGTRHKGSGYSPVRKKSGKKLFRKNRKLARKPKFRSQSAARRKLSKSTLRAAKLRNRAKGVKGAKNLRKAKKAHKYVKAAKIMAAGTGVGAVAGLAASAAGLDPAELALLKATDPAAYRRKMRALKKNPAKYVAKNVSGNVKKAGKGIKKFGKKVGKVFKRKKRRNRR